MTTTISVSPEVIARLPDMLVAYLWQLALDDKYRGYPVQTFMLEPVSLSGREIQGISHLDEERRVFGLAPVTCRLCVLNSGNRYRMTLAE